MAYRKLLIDNVVCSRRFHLTYDDEAKGEKIEVRCPFCDMTIFQSANHPPVTLARQENVITSDTSLANGIVRECHLKDVFTEKTRKTPSQPHA